MVALTCRAGAARGVAALQAQVPPHTAREQALETRLLAEANGCQQMKEHQAGFSQWKAMDALCEMKTLKVVFRVGRKMWYLGWRDRKRTEGWIQPKETRKAMATLCQKEKKTTLLTTMNLGRGRMGASSSLVARNIRIRQYSAQPCK